MRTSKAILRAASVAKMPDPAVLTLLREEIAFVVAKLALLGRCHHFQKSALMDVAQQVFRFDEMVAGVEIAVILQRRAVSASRGVDAQQMAAKECLKRDIEQLNKHLAHIVTNPLLKNIDEKLSVLPAADGPVGYQVAGLGIEDAFAVRPVRSSPDSQFRIVSALARSTMGMNCTHFAPISSRKKR